MTWRKESVSDKRKQGMRSAGRGVLRWRRTRSRGNVSPFYFWLFLNVECVTEKLSSDKVSSYECFLSDPEVHIGLENLQQFPAFGSPPHNGSPQVYPEFLLAPPSALTSSAVSGETSSFNCPLFWQAWKFKVSLFYGLLIVMFVFCAMEFVFYLTIYLTRQVS